MSGENFGNQINQIMNTAINVVFEQGKYAQLTHSAYEQVINKIDI